MWKSGLFCVMVATRLGFLGKKHIALACHPQTLFN